MLRYIVHYDEICLKGGNRKFFEKKLLGNLKVILKSVVKCRLVFLRDRILVESQEDSKEEELLATLKKISGICTFYKIETCNLDMKEIEELCVKAAKDFKGTFKVVAKRTNKSFPIQSPDIQRFAGIKI